MRELAQNASNENINKDIVKLTITKVLTTIIATFTSMLLARFRTLEEYGTYSQMLIVINLFTSIFMLGLPNSLNYFISRAETEKEKQNFVNVYYTLSTLLSFVLGLSLSLSSNIIVKYFDNEYIKVFIYFLALFPWTKIVTGSLENLLVVYKKTKALLIIKLIHNVALLGIVLFFQMTKTSFEIYMICFTSFEVLVTLVDYFVIRKVSGVLKPLLMWKMIKKIFAFSIPIGLASIVGIINIELDKIVIDQFFSTEELGVYSACCAELPLTIIATSITAVALPVMVAFVKEGEITKAIEKWKKTIIVSFAIIVVFSIGLSFFAEEAVLLLYGDKYLPGANVFRIYSLTLMLKCTYFGMMLNALGKTKFILVSSIISLVTNIILNYACYFLFGFEGPAIATFVSTLAMVITQLIATCFITKIKFTDIMPWKSVATLLFINVALGGILSLVKFYIPLEQYISSIGEALILGVVWSLFYALICGKRVLYVFKNI